MRVEFWISSAQILQQMMNEWVSEWVSEWVRTEFGILLRFFNKWELRLEFGFVLTFFNSLHASSSLHLCSWNPSCHWVSITSQNFFWSIQGELFCERSLLVIQLISIQKTKSSIHSRRNYFPQMVEIGIRGIRFFLCQVGRIVCCRPCTISACSILAIEILWNTCVLGCGHFFFPFFGVEICF